MEFSAFEQVFKEKKTNFKKINSSPVGEFARGDTYMFALVDNIHLPKSVGYASTTPTEIVLLYTSEGLSLYNESTEKWMFEVLCRENTRLSFGTWIFTKREMKFQIMYRTTLKNLVPLDKTELESIIQTTQREYTQLGRRLKESLQNPRPESRIFTQMSQSRAELISELLMKYNGKKKSEDRYKISCEINTSRHASHQQNKFKGFVTLADEYFVLQLFIKVKMYKEEGAFITRADPHKINAYNKIVANWLNSSSKNKVGTVVYSEESKKRYFTYRIEHYFDTGKQEQIAELFKKLLEFCARKVRHRCVAVNPLTWNVRKITQEVAMMSMLSTRSTYSLTTFYVATSHDSIAKIAKFWAGYFETLKGREISANEEMYILPLETKPLFNIEHPLGLHLQCLIYEILLKKEDEKLIEIDSDAEKANKKYEIDEVKEINFHRVSSANLTNMLLPQFQLFPEKFRTSASRGEIYSLQKKVEIRVRVVASIKDNSNLWSIAKAIFPTVISSMQPDSVTPRLIGLVNRSNNLEIVEQFYDTLSSKQISEEFKRRFLIGLAMKLEDLHSREIYHLMLCPANIGITEGCAPMLCNVRVCGLTLPSLDSIRDDSQLYFLAPEVLQLMSKRQDVGRKNTGSWVVDYLHVSGAADVYSFGVVMHWLLDTQPSKGPLDRLRDEIEERKNQPLVPRSSEEQLIHQPSRRDEVEEKRSQPLAPQPFEVMLDTQSPKRDEAEERKRQPLVSQPPKRYEIEERKRQPLASQSSKGDEVEETSSLSPEELLIAQRHKELLDWWRDEVAVKKCRPLVSVDFEVREPLLTDLMHRCWASRRLRPSMREVVRALQDANILL